MTSTQQYLLRDLMENADFVMAIGEICAEEAKRHSEGMCRSIDCGEFNNAAIHRGAHRAWSKELIQALESRTKKFQKTERSA